MEITNIEIAIDRVMRDFDFKQTLLIYEFLNWKWAGESITFDTITNKVKQYLLKCYNEALKNKSKKQYISTGGLEYYCEIEMEKNKIKDIFLSIKFVPVEAQSEYY